MCTVIALRRWHKDYPLIIAANRDETYDRPSAPPGPIGSTGALGGTDLLYGGTWAAVKPDGLFVALTNQRTWGKTGNWYKSRGQALVDLMADPPSIWDLKSEGYKPFNLLMGTYDQMLTFNYRDDGESSYHAVPDGINVLPNDSLNHPDIPKVHRVRELLAGHENLPWDALVTKLAETLADHELPAMEDVPKPPTDVVCDAVTGQQVQAVCVHAKDYGTVSSFIWAFDEQGLAHYLYASGPPCVSGFREQECTV